MHIIQFKLEFRLEIFLLGVTMICRDNLQDNTVSPRPARPHATRCYCAPDDAIYNCTQTRAQSSLDAFLMQIFDWFWLHLAAIYVACPHPGSFSSNYGCQVAGRAWQAVRHSSDPSSVGGEGSQASQLSPRPASVHRVITFHSLQLSHYLSLHGLTTHSRLRRPAPGPRHNLPSYRVNSCGKNSHS